MTEPAINLSDDQWASFAEHAYESYRRALGSYGVRGVPLRPWGSLAQEIQFAWVTAVKQVAVDFDIRPLEVAVLAPTLSPEAVTEIVAAAKELEAEELEAEELEAEELAKEPADESDVEPVPVTDGVIEADGQDGN